MLHNFINQGHQPTITYQLFSNEANLVSHIFKDDYEVEAAVTQWLITWTVRTANKKAHRVIRCLN